MGTANIKTRAHHRRVLWKKPAQLRTDAGTQLGRITPGAQTFLTWTRECEVMHALVTGGAGFIGSHLVGELLDRGHAVSVLDDLSTGQEMKLPEQATLHVGDVGDDDVVTPAVADADVVFHQAGLVSVDRSIAAPLASHATNVTGTLRVLEAAREHDTRVVLASSAAIYGSPTYTPIDEDHPLAPTSPYGLDKLAADQYTRLYHDLYDLETVSLRYFNVFGPRQTGGAYAGVVSVFVEQALAGEPLTVHGDGSQTRDFVFIDDVVEANLCAASTDTVGRAYNVATGSGLTIGELAETIIDVTQSSSDVVHVTPRAGDIDRSVADVSAARGDLGFEASVSLREGLERTVEWFRSEREIDGSIE